MAITSWVGHSVINNGAPEILTLWHLGQPVQDDQDPQQQWKMIMAGADEFSR